VVTAGTIHHRPTDKRVLSDLIRDRRSQRLNGRIGPGEEVFTGFPATDVERSGPARAAIELHAVQDDLSQRGAEIRAHVVVNNGLISTLGKELRHAIRRRGCWGHAPVIARDDVGR
jgi:hypothetical protein